MGKRKRLFPRQYSSSYIKTDRFDANKSAAYTAQRSKATIGSRNDTEHNLNSNFTQEVPRTRSLSTYDNDWDEWIRSERGKVVDTKHDLIAIEEQRKIKKFISYYKVWQGKKHQGVAEYYCVILKKFGDDFKLMLFFSGQEFLFVQECENTRRISRTYIGREDAMRQYNNNNISWLHIETIKS